MMSLDNTNIKNALQELQSKFVITPIGKAKGNNAIICKRFYAIVLLKELGLYDKTKQSTNKTCEEIYGRTVEKIIFEHNTYIANKFHIDNTSQNPPKIYWLPKKHKNPLKARFIIAASDCFLKKLSKDITSIFKF